MTAQIAQGDADLVQSFDPANLPPDFIDDPYPYYRALRTTEPVKPCPDGSYFLTRYADLLAVYRDANRFSSDKKVEFGAKYGPSPLYDHHTTSLVFNDPPLHSRVRKILVGALTPRAIAAMEPDLVSLVDRLLDEMAGPEVVDLIEDYAAAIPVEVIGNLLGIPHADRDPLRGWSLAILGALEPVLTNEQEHRGNQSVREFSAYLADLIEARRKRPVDPDRDVLTRLIEWGSGPGLSPEELIQNCIFILNAGHETTTNMIGNALHVLAAWPDQLERIKRDPAAIDDLVEEVLRFESSNQLGNRITTEPVSFDGIDMPAGTRLTLCIGAANRDPDQFPDPERFDIARTPNRHLAFGSGPHTCAGLSLARLEGRIAIGRFLDRFPNYWIAGPAVRNRRVRFRGFKELPARLTGASHSRNKL